MILKHGVDPHRIVYANPYKKISHIQYAVDHGVYRMTFDCIDEVEKMLSVSEKIEMIIRIAPTDDSMSAFQHSKKFGVKRGHYLDILSQCRELGANLIGLSFHVGTCCPTDTAYVDTVELSAEVFKIAESVGYHFKLLDIGGGFPGNDDILVFENVAQAIGPLIDQLFPPEVEVISEPGTYIAARSVTVVSHLFSRKFEKTEKGMQRNYLVDDGVYGNFQINFIEGSMKRIPVVLSKHQMDTHDIHTSTIWGQTCDSVDFVSKDIMIPELNIGDWLIHSDMGAYSICLNTSFNGFEPNRIIYMNTNKE